MKLRLHHARVLPMRHHATATPPASGAKEQQSTNDNLIEKKKG